MKNLFIINQPQKLDEAKPYIAEHDAVLLIEDAVVLASNEATQPQFLKYVLEEDLTVRGLKKKAANGWTLIDYPQFVELTLQYNKSVSWL